MCVCRDHIDLLERNNQLILELKHLDSTPAQRLQCTRVYVVFKVYVICVCLLVIDDQANIISGSCRVFISIEVNRVCVCVCVSNMASGLLFSNYLCLETQMSVTCLLVLHVYVHTYSKCTNKCQHTHTHNCMLPLGASAALSTQ